MRVAVIPPAPGLLARYASLTDPFADVRFTSLAAVAWLVEPGPDAVVVLGDDVDVQRGVAQELLAGAGYRGPADLTGFRGSAVAGLAPQPPAAVLLLLNGSARRGEKAPGHLDERAFAFDGQVAAALAGDAEARSALATGLGDELLASGVRALRELDLSGGEAVVGYAGDPFGVQYWVVRWESTRSPGMPTDG